MKIEISPKLKVGTELYWVTGFNITKISIHSIITETIENTKFYYLVKPFNSPKMMKTNDEASMFVSLKNAKQLVIQNMKIAIQQKKIQIENINEKDFVVKEVEK